MSRRSHKAQEPRAINSADELILSEAIRCERQVPHACFALHDQTEGMAAFIEKRAADFVFGKTKAMPAYLARRTWLTERAAALWLHALDRKPADRHPADALRRLDRARPGLRASRPGSAARPTPSACSATSPAHRTASPTRAPMRTRRCTMIRTVPRPMQRRWAPISGRRGCSIYVDAAR